MKRKFSARVLCAALIQGLALGALSGCFEDNKTAASGEAASGQSAAPNDSSAPPEMAVAPPRPSSSPDAPAPYVPDPEREARRNRPITAEDMQTA